MKERTVDDQDRWMRPINSFSGITFVPLDVYERAIHLWTNPGEIVVEPFMGVGSGPWSAKVNGRLGWGCELKPSFFRQAKRNLLLSRAQVEGVPESGGRRQASIDFGDDDDSSEPTQ